MDCKKWGILKVSCPSAIDWSFYNSARKIQRSLQYNSDPNAKVIHHLRDTEEQRKYNDTYYERWGFNEDGTFEYGKYVVFVTEEWHNNYHSQSEETRKKISESNKANYSEERKAKVRLTHLGKHVSDETRKKLSESARNKPPVSDETRKKLSENNAKYNLGKHLSEDTRRKISLNRKGKAAGENHHFYHKHFSDEHREKLSKSHIGNFHTESTKEKMSQSQKAAWANDSERRINQSNAFKGSGNPNYGINLSDERKADISKTQIALWSNKEYRDKMSKAHTGIKQSRESVLKRNTLNSEKMKAVLLAYEMHKECGGTMSWNEFQKYYKRLKQSKDSSDV